MATRRAGMRKAIVAGGASLILAMGLVGCGNNGGQGKPAASDQTATVHDEGARTNASESENVAAARYTQSFEQAMITDDIPEGQQLPPDRTRAGKPTAPLNAAVKQLWPKFSLADGQGNPIHFVASVDTAAGTFEITLRPEWAPNHVRNFIALSTVGYYEGLCFDRIVHQETETQDGEKVRVDLVRGGCPIGTGEGGLGHIGYFVKPEPPEHLKHEEGTVGFWRDANPASAGCRFYITLGPAPTIDGEFALIGKVTKGIDIVKQIASRPVIDPKTYPECEQPAQPVGIRKITITPGYNQP